jgi:hypothetical protein
MDRRRPRYAASHDSHVGAVRPDLRDLLRVPSPPEHEIAGDVGDLGKTGPLSQGFQAGGKALRMCHKNGMEVRKKRPRRGFKKRPRGFK